MKDNVLYYEDAVTYGSEVKNVYERAIERNAKYYRATAGGKYYGWVNGKHVAAESGQEWFDNPEYKEPIVQSEETLIITDEQTGVAEAAELDSENSLASADKAISDEAADMIAKLQEQVSDLKNELSQKIEQYESATAKLNELSNAVKIIVDFIKGV